jgi:hypothetical protein
VNDEPTSFQNTVKCPFFQTATDNSTLFRLTGSYQTLAVKVPHAKISPRHKKAHHMSLCETFDGLREKDSKKTKRL